MGTSAVVYNVPGLRDSAKACGSGIIVSRNQPKNLAEESVKLLKGNPRSMDLVQKAFQETKKLCWNGKDVLFISSTCMCLR